ncbi:MAG: hypothetical protein K2N27_11220 [Ruminococcus sp.]|nr:hypothetical protein [Ruminococcus sp.]
MSRFIKRQNNLRKAQAKFEKASRRSKQFKIRFERSQNSRGRFRTRADIIREEKTFHGSNRGLAHKVFNLKNRIEGDVPSITKTINSFQPKTFKGKLFKKSAQAVNFTVHDTAQTTVDAVLASETIGLKSADAVKREIVNNLKQKYSREAVDDYHRGTLETLCIGADAVKGTHNHFKSKKQYKLEKAKFRLKKAEYDIFKEDTFKPKMRKNKADFKVKKAEYRQHRRDFRHSSQSNIQRAFLIKRKQDFKQSKREIKFDSKKLKSEKKFKRKELKNQLKIKKNSKTGFLIFKPASYTANRMKASTWQKAVNEDSDNDMLHALDSTKRRIAEPVIQKVSKPERLQRQQKKRDNLSDKEKKKKKRLNKQENRLKVKNRQSPKKRKKTKFKKSFSRNSRTSASC